MDVRMLFSWDTYMWLRTFVLCICKTGLARTHCDISRGFLTPDIRRFSIHLEFYRGFLIQWLVMVTEPIPVKRIQVLVEAFVEPKRMLQLRRQGKLMRKMWNCHRVRKDHFWILQPRRKVELIHRTRLRMLLRNFYPTVLTQS